MNDDDLKLEKKRFGLSLFFPVIFLVVIWLVKLYELGMDKSLAGFGIYPLKLEGLIGVLAAPLVHKDFSHLASNSVPLLFLGVGLFYFYSKVAFRVLILIYIFSGLWVWFGGRLAYHIGASGIAYGLASFLFFSGIIRNFYRLIALSLTIVFLYGGMFWGMFPILPEVSWESHLSGAVIGFILAFYYRSEGPQKEKRELEDEDYEVEFWKIEENKN